MVCKCLLPQCYYMPPSICNSRSPWTLWNQSIQSSEEHNPLPHLDRKSPLWILVNICLHKYKFWRKQSIVYHNFTWIPLGSKSHFLWKKCPCPDLLTTHAHKILSPHTHYYLGKKCFEMTQQEIWYKMWWFTCTTSLICKSTHCCQLLSTTSPRLADMRKLADGLDVICISLRRI